MHCIQEMMKPQQVLEPNGTISVMTPFISLKLATAATCAVPECEYCLLVRAKNRSPGVAKVKHVPDKEVILACNKYEVGYFFSAGKSVVRTPGILPTGYGRERCHNRFHGGTIYNYAASGLIWVENQVSLGSNETVLGKSRFEEWLWEQASAEISHYHSDNGVFLDNEYRNHCENKGQTQIFSGVGAQHQNARAERAIQTIIYMACIFMIHSALPWTDIEVDDLSLWYFSVKHSVWCIIEYQIRFQELLQWKCSPRQSPIISTCGVPTFGGALCMCWNPNFKITRSFSSGIDGRV